jgi:hypothetical protein
MMEISDATRGRVMVKVMMDSAGLDYAEVEKLRDDLAALAAQRFPSAIGDAVAQDLPAGARNWRRIGDKVILGDA